MKKTGNGIDTLVQDCINDSLTKAMDKKCKNKDIFLNKDHIFDTDFYYPYSDSHGLVDTRREIFEFSIEVKNLKFKEEDQFLFRDFTDTIIIRYMVVAVCACEDHPGAYRVRAIYKGHM
jgi:hypothetical protein